MITLNPALPNPFLVLEPFGSFADCARAHGDRLTEHYENNGVIILPQVPIAFDLSLMETISFPQSAKKIGTKNGIALPIHKRDGKTLTVDTAHPLVSMTSGNAVFASYLQTQIATFNYQLSLGLQMLFPRYRLPAEPSISWRLTPTGDEGPHLDCFGGGRPHPPQLRRMQRLKVFVNIDAAPRHWRISYALPELLKHCRDRLPSRLPADVNVLNDVLNRLGVLDTLPFHDLHYPQMTAVIANGETIVHQVVSGQRMIAYEVRLDANDMLDSAKLSRDSVRAWIESAGIGADEGPDLRADRYTTAASTYVA